MLLRFPYNFAHWKAISLPPHSALGCGEVCIHKSLGERTDYPAFNSNRVHPLGEVNQARKSKKDFWQNEPDSGIASSCQPLFFRCIFSG